MSEPFKFFYLDKESNRVGIHENCPKSPHGALVDFQGLARMDNDGTQLYLYKCMSCNQMVWAGIDSESYIRVLEYDAPPTPVKTEEPVMNYTQKKELADKLKTKLKFWESIDILDETCFMLSIDYCATLYVYADSTLQLNTSQGGGHGDPGGSLGRIPIKKLQSLLVEGYAIATTLWGEEWLSLHEKKT